MRTSSRTSGSCSPAAAGPAAARPAKPSAASALPWRPGRRPRAALGAAVQVLLVAALLAGALHEGSCEHLSAGGPASVARRPLAAAATSRRAARRARALLAPEPSALVPPPVAPPPKNRTAVTAAAAATQQKQLGVRDLPDVPQCMWNDVRGFCQPGQLAYLSVTAQPETLLHRAVVVSYDRNLACAGNAEEGLCNKDRGNRCMWWNKSCVGMDAFELVNWIGTEIPDGASALAAFTCPGTPAAAYKACATASDAREGGVCNSLPGCHYVPMMEACLPVSLDNATFRDVQVLRAGYDTFSVAAWGTCAGACYARQALICESISNSSAACAKKPFCVWGTDAFTGAQVCAHRDNASRGADAFSREYAALQDQCNNATTADACEELRVVPRQLGKYTDGKLLAAPAPPAAGLAAAVAAEKGAAAACPL